MNYWHRYKPFLLFLGKFFFTYLILTVIYHWYLSGYDTSKAEVDPITESVAFQTTDLLQLFGIDSSTEKHVSQPCIKLFFNKKYVARIIE
ncbi:MAG TPA: exosortase family protein XrtF, partial [Flavobacterium sp.]